MSCGTVHAEPKDLSLTELCSQATAMNLLRAFHKMDKARQRMLVDVALALGGDTERSTGPAQALAS